MPAGAGSTRQRGILLPLLRARICGRARDDGGFTLVEALAAMVVFGIFMTGLTSGMITLSRTLVKTRIRAAAVTVAQQQIEKARSVAYSNLSLKQVPGIPTRWTRSDSGTTTYKVDVTPSCSGCLEWHPTPVSAAGTSFTVEQWVLDNTDQPIQTEAGLKLWEKYLRVIVTWTAPTSGKIDMVTTFNNPMPLQPDPPQGLDINAKDIATGNLIGATPDDPEVFDITISDGSGNLVTAPMDEGTYSNRTIAAGTYTCTVSMNPTSTQSWTSTSSGTDTYSFTCTVTAGQVTPAYDTFWTSSADCPISSTNGTLTVTVLDGTTMAPVNGAQVQPQNARTLALIGAKSTNSSGTISFGVKGDSYNYQVTGLSGYQNTGWLGPVCVYANRTINVTALVNPNPTGPTMTVKVPIKNGESAANVYTVMLEFGGQSTSQNISIAPTKTGTPVFDNMPVGNPYHVVICRQEQSGNCNQIHDWPNSTYPNTDFSTSGKTYTTSPNPWPDLPG